MNKKYNKLIYGTGAMIFVLIIAITIAYLMSGNNNSKLDKVKAEENSTKDIAVNPGINRLKKSNKASNIYTADEIIAEKIAIASARKNNGEIIFEQAQAYANNNSQSIAENLNTQDEKKNTANSENVASSKDAAKSNEAAKSKDATKTKDVENSSNIQNTANTQNTVNADNSTNTEEATDAENTAISEGNQENRDNEQSSEMVSPQWIYYGSAVKPPYDSEMKSQIDAKVASWVNGSLSDSELQQWIIDYVHDEKGLPMRSVGFIGNYKVLLHLENNIDYSRCFDEMNAYYSFIGIYTKGERDEYGNLIGYRWDLSIG